MAIAPTVVWVVGVAPKVCRVINHSLRALRRVAVGTAIRPSRTVSPKDHPLVMDLHQRNGPASEPSPDPELELLARAIDGDAEAYGDLYERYVEDIYRYIHRWVGETSQAEDLTETVFLKAWKALAGFTPGKVPFRAWLFRVARNLLIDHHRMRHRYNHLPAEPWLSDPSPSPEQRLIETEQNQQLADALQQLSPEHREILSLRFLSGLSHADAAKVVGRSEGAVRMLQFRALKALQAAMVSDGGKRHG